MEKLASERGASPLESEDSQARSDPAREALFACLSQLGQVRGKARRPISASKWPPEIVELLGGLDVTQSGDPKKTSTPLSFF